MCDLRVNTNHNPYLPMFNACQHYSSRSRSKHVWIGPVNIFFRNYQNCAGFHQALFGVIGFQNNNLWEIQYNLEIIPEIIKTNTVLKRGTQPSYCSDEPVCIL